MNVTEVIELAYQHARGKSTTPTSGNKYNSLILLCDSLQKIWAAEPNVEWNSLYSKVDIGEVTATNSFALDSTIDHIVKRETDPIYISDDSEERQHIYNLVQPNQLYTFRNENGVARAGNNLIFNTAFASGDTEFGKNIYVPSILKIGDLTTGSDTVEVDNPMWLVFMVAAEFVRTDLVRTNQYDRLVTYAQEVMQEMKQNNRGQNEKVITEFAPPGAESME